MYNCNAKLNLAQYEAIQLQSNITIHKGEGLNWK